jgi:hypothetical protein
MKSIYTLSCVTSLSLACTAAPPVPDRAAHAADSAAATSRVSAPDAPAKDEARAGETSEVTWKHPGMAMTFRYPDQLLTVQHKPDGAYLKSEILGVVEDRSDRGEDRPSPFTIMISVRVGKLLDVVKSDGLANMFPGGTEESFAAEKDVSERVTVAGKAGYSLIMASHGEFEQVVFAGLGDAWTLVIRCDFVGEAAKPRVPVAEQIDACDKVVSTLALEI